MLDRRLFVDRTEQTTDDELNVTPLTKLLHGSPFSLYDASEVVKQDPLTSSSRRTTMFNYDPLCFAFLSQLLNDKKNSNNGSTRN